MSDAIVCDRCETIFAGPALAVIQLGQWQGELCQDCAEVLEDWISESEDTKSRTKTLGEHLEERDAE